MEIKLAKIISEAIKLSKMSEKYYIEIDISLFFETAEINIRTKKGHDFVETFKLYLDKLEAENIDKIIEHIQNYEEEKSC